MARPYTLVDVKELMFCERVGIVNSHIQPHV